VVNWGVVGSIVLYASRGATVVVADVMRDGVVRATAATARADTLSTVVVRAVSTVVVRTDSTVVARAVSTLVVVRVVRRGVVRPMTGVVALPRTASAHSPEQDQPSSIAPMAPDAHAS